MERHERHASRACTSVQMGSFNGDGQRNDYVAFFLKEEGHALQFPRRIADTKKYLYDGVKFGIDVSVNESRFSEYKNKLHAIYGMAECLIELS